MTEVLFARLDELQAFFPVSLLTGVTGILPAANGGGVNILETFPGATSTAKLQAAIAAGVKYVQLSQGITITAQIDLPANFVLNANGFIISLGANVTQMFTMDTGAQLINTVIDGNGVNFTGKGVGIIAGNNQRFVNVDIRNTTDFNLDFAANLGQNFEWLGGSAQRTVPTSPAIRTVSELQTSGPRFFVEVNMNGGAGYDIGGHYTVIQGGSMTTFTMRSTASYTQVIGGTRVAGAPNIDGANGVFNGIFDAGLTINAGATQNTIYAQPGLTITDSSGLATNQIIPAPSNTWTQYMGAGNRVGWQLLQAGSAALTIGTQAANLPYIRGQNSLGLRLGSNATDYFFLASGGNIGIGTASTPASPLTISQNATQLTPPTNAILELILNDNVGAPIVYEGYGANSVPSIGTYRALGTAGTPAVLATGNQLFALWGKGYDGVGPWATAFPGIILAAAEAFSSGHNGTRLDFVTVPIGATAGATAVRVQASGGMSIGAAATDPGIGALLANTSIKSQGATAGIGYATGAGGAVTQVTSRNQGVTLNTVSGDITLIAGVNAAVSGATANTVVVTNSAVGVKDTIEVSQQSGTDKYLVFVTNVSNGSFAITFYTTGGTTNESPVFHYNIVKGVNA